MKLFQKMRTWLTHMLCKHNWMTVGEVSRFTDRDEHGVMVECLSEVRVCRRCGKRENHFIRIPHG